jgi:poly-gamma-glutamate synthesis protein (capsule biosynthesis protein)
MKRALVLLGLTAVVACTAPNGSDEEDAADDSAVEASDITADVPVGGEDETASPDALAPAPFDHEDTDLIDIRGVGDSAWSKTHEKDPIAAGFGAALAKFDPTHTLLRGDLSFINWETVVGNHCNQFSSAYSPGRSYAFLSRPENLTQAYEHGFNLVGLSNNHARDCSNGGGEDTSSKLSVPFLDQLSSDQHWMWAGIGLAQPDVTKAKVETFDIKGRKIRVAFASLYTGRASCPLATCQSDATAVMTSLRDAPADIRILALHSQDSQPQLVKTGTDFIQKFNGDVVMGHGPHIWKPVRIVRKDGGGKGVFFESFGNFLHPGCASQARNVIGRALFDRSLQLRQIQLVPVQNNGLAVNISSVDARTIGGNVRFTSLGGANRAVYANIKP